jgi:pseudouridine-5'-phosphate glycosidase
VIRLSAEVEHALREGRPVVALETTLVAHGFPSGEGMTVAFESEHRVRGAGAVPAVTGVLDGQIHAGLEPADLERFDAAARKVGPRDLAACAAQGAVGATTVGGTLAICSAAGIRFMATGGIGGVHRGFPFPPDVSGDLAELSRSPTLVVSSGIKSFLDVEATAEALETLGVPVVGFRTDEVPLFYSAGGGPRVSARAESPEEAAGVARVHWDLGRSGLVVARPPDRSLEGVEPLIEAALEEAERRGLTRR